MARLITIRGAGKTEVKPDMAVLVLTVSARERKCAAAVDAAAGQVQKLTAALAAAGLAEDCVETESYTAFPEYGPGRRNPEAYQCVHRLKLRTDCGPEGLGRALSVIFTQLEKPVLDLTFTVKDRAAVEETLLKNAAADAMRKARAMCGACGASLGRLAAVNYQCGRLDLCTGPARSLEETAGFPALGGADAQALRGAVALLQPGALELSDCAEFAWEIE